MSETTNVIDTTTSTNGEAPKAPKSRVAKAVKATKKAPAKVAKKSTAAKADKNRGMKSGVAAKDRRRALVKLLRKFGATGVTTSRPIKFLAEKLDYTDYDVYCLVYHKYQLAVAGLVKTCQVEDVHGLSVYLSAKGVKATDEQIP